MSDSADFREAQRRIEAAYDPELLRVAGRRLIDLLADHLAKSRSVRTAVLPWHEPAENVRAAAATLDEAVGSGAGRDALADRFAGLVQTMLDRGHNLHDPRYIGHQVAASVPLAGLFDAVGSVTNQVMATYDMGPWATAAERAMVERLGEQIGWPRGEFSGLATHGGSLANLTALLTARNVTLHDSWEQGDGRVRPVRRCWWFMPTPTTAFPARRESLAWEPITSSAWGLTGGVAWTCISWRRRSAICGRRTSRSSPSSPVRVRRRSGLSIRSRTWPTCASGTAFGCTSMRRTAERPA